MKEKNTTIKIVVILGIFILAPFLFLERVNAQPVDADTTFRTDSEIGIGVITIPFFNQPLGPGGEYATLFSWVSFFGVIFTLGIIIFWVFLLLKAGIKAFQSEGTPEGLSEAYKQAKAVFIGAGLSLAFPVLLTVLGLVLGVGGIWTWPKAFRDCPNSPDHNFYVQAFLDIQDDGVTDAEREANILCYGRAVVES